MSDAYARALCRVVVAQITRGYRFSAISQSACEALTDIIGLYVEEIGSRAHQYCELASRTECNFHDVHEAFLDMSIDMNELHKFLIQAEEIPFARTIPPFPLSAQKITEAQQQQQQKQLTTTINNINTSTSSTTSNLNNNNNNNNNNKEENEQSSSSTTTTTTNNNSNNNSQTNTQQQTSTQQQELPPHIPSFLPSFPDKHTYAKTPLFGEVVTDSHTLKKTKSKQKRKIEQTLTKLSTITTPQPITSYDMKDQPRQSSRKSKKDRNGHHRSDRNRDRDRERERDTNGNTNGNGNGNGTTGDEVIMDDINNNNNNNNQNGNNVAKEDEQQQQQQQQQINTPTPLHDINTSFYIKHDDDLKKIEDVPTRRALLSEEDNERVKKKLKCERILSMTHENTSSSLNSAANSSLAAGNINDEDQKENSKQNSSNSKDIILEREKI
ncbi:hypothetical protein PPL_07663 [Heterostelium album PN500]|uniref:Transcription initiation factor TFIID subunit 8 n=1 Tax=Heterostelium pallidum (strain ATCC 26659 / Pp 5 / PN500) TaxID=670386 RepID=D3BGL1_HETP5|nr:hypothetical protein PPL_07663 [Heterostelium album PN500]EFA79245.1 hypothetical protein PPL_07663 [Heterostelium album PN500]|eukprot:XP_020431366.1 hypothetical protein PPL_07663 [Heterostelium album PN500]